MLGAQILLFAVFAVLAGLITGATIVAAAPHPPAVPVARGRHHPVDVPALRTAGRRRSSCSRSCIPAILVGQRAAGGWQTYLLWRHATPFHATDPMFHKDDSFFVEVYPFHQLVSACCCRRSPTRLWIAVVGGTATAHGGCGAGAGRSRAGSPLLVSALAAGYLVLQGGQLLALALRADHLARGPVTGRPTPTCTRRCRARTS